MFVCVCMRAITYAERIAANTYVFCGTLGTLRRSVSVSTFSCHDTHLRLFSSHPLPSLSPIWRLGKAGVRLLETSPVSASVKAGEVSHTVQGHDGRDAD